MKIEIAITAAGILLQWETPGPGSYQLFSSTDRPHTALVVASGYVRQASHCAVTLPRDAACRLFWVGWERSLLAGL